MEPEKEKHEPIMETRRTPTHYFGGLLILILTAITLYGMYRFFQRRRRPRPGFTSSTSPSFLSSIFGNTRDASSIYNPVNNVFPFSHT
jgi:hypothetical protein